MLAAARSDLGAIDERYQLPGLEAERELLRRADSVLAAIRSQSADFPAWARIWPSVRRSLLWSKRRSLYAKRLLRHFIDEKEAARAAATSS
jgi:hypothetical protein